MDTDVPVPVNIFSDFAIICLPITMVSRLQMKLKQKIAVGGVFALGFFVIISSSTWWTLQKLFNNQAQVLIPNSRPRVLLAP